MPVMKAVTTSWSALRCSYSTRNFGHHTVLTVATRVRAGSGAIIAMIWTEFSHLNLTSTTQSSFFSSVCLRLKQATTFKRPTRQLAEARTNGKLSYTMVTRAFLQDRQALRAIATTGYRSNLAPIQHSSRHDQWIIENQRYNHDFLSRQAQAMKKAAPHWCKPSHLSWSVTNTKTGACFVHRM